MIDYILLYQSDGEAIYSKCLGGFCQKAAFNVQQLEDMLMKIANVPSFFIKNSGDEMRKYSMGAINIIFHALPDRDVILCLGMGTEVDEQMEVQIRLYAREILVHYTNIVSESKNLDDRVRINIYNYLEGLTDHFGHIIETMETTCPAGDTCPLIFDYSSALAMWKQIKQNYSGQMDKNGEIVTTEVEDTGDSN